MKKVLMAVGFIAVTSLLQAEIIKDDKILSIINEKVNNLSDCDTIVVYEDYNIHIVKQNDQTIKGGSRSDIENTLSKM